MDFMSDDFASFCPVMDLSTTNNSNNNKTSSPSPSNGEDGASSEAGDNGGGSYMSSLRSRSRRGGGGGTPSQVVGDDDGGGGGAFSMKETFHLLDAVNKHLSELTNPKLKKYRIWVRIAEDVNKTCDAKFNGGQCSSRFRNLKCRFGKVQSHFKATGELKTWPFYNRMLGMFPDEASFNWLNTVVAGDAKQEAEDGGGDDQQAEDDDAMMDDQELGDEDDEQETSTTGTSNRGGGGSRPRGGHTAGFTTNSAGELVPCFTLRESMNLLDVVKKHIGELKDPRTCKGKIWAKVAAEVNKKCGCGHTGAQCSARYRNLKCRFLKRKQKGTDMTWTFGVKLASVLEAENEVKVELAAAAGSLSDTSTGNQQQQQHHQLSSLLASGNSSNGKMSSTSTIHDDEPMPLKVSPPSSSSRNNQLAPTVTPADLRSHRSSSSTGLTGSSSNLHQQSQPLDLHHTRHQSTGGGSLLHHASPSIGGIGHHSSTGGSAFSAFQQQQQRRRRSRISTGPRSRFPGAAVATSAKDLLSSGQVNLVSHASPIASAPAVEASLGGSSSGSDCFTASETVTLLDLVAKYLKDLNSPAESGVRRHDIWTRIAAELNDSYGTHYTSTQCSARFRNLKCRFIKTQEYNRVTGADKKVAFNDNIARLFAADTSMGSDSPLNGSGNVNLTTIDNNSSSSEQISPMPMVNKAQNNTKSPPVSLGYASPPTPSSINNYQNGVNGGTSHNNNNISPPGAHLSNNNNNNNNNSNNAFQRQAQRHVPPSSPSVASNRSASTTPAMKQNGAMPLVLSSNGQTKLVSNNNNNNKTLVNGTSSSSSYYENNHHTNSQQIIQNAHSRSPSSTSFALPQPVHLNNRPQSHQSLHNNSNSNNNVSSNQPSLFSNRQHQSSCGVDLSGGSGHLQKQITANSSAGLVSPQNRVVQNSSNSNNNQPAAQQVAVVRPGREAVIEQLRVMHDDWIQVTERRHQEIMTVLRQLASHMAAAGLSTPVSLVDGATATALVMCQQPVATVIDGAEELLDEAIDDVDEEQEEIIEQEEIEADEEEIATETNEKTDELDDNLMSGVIEEEEEDTAISTSNIKVEMNGDEIDEEVDEADLASSISSTVVELAE